MALYLELAPKTLVRDRKTGNVGRVTAVSSPSGQRRRVTVRWNGGGSAEYVGTQDPTYLQISDLEVVRYVGGGRYEPVI